MPPFCEPLAVSCERSAFSRPWAKQSPLYLMGRDVARVGVPELAIWDMALMGGVPRRHCIGFWAPPSLKPMCPVFVCLADRYCPFTKEQGPRYFGAPAYGSNSQEWLVFFSHSDGYHPRLPPFFPALVHLVLEELDVLLGEVGEPSLASQVVPDGLPLPYTSGDGPGGTV